MSWRSAALKLPVILHWIYIVWSIISQYYTYDFGPVIQYLLGLAVFLTLLYLVPLIDI